MTQIREEVGFTKGRIIVRGKLVTRGKAKRADYLLYYKPNLPLALIEAKDNNHASATGCSRRSTMPRRSDIPFVFTSNGDGFVFHDRTGPAPRSKRQIALDEFPSPQALWASTARGRGWTRSEERIVLQDYYDDGSDGNRAIIRSRPLIATIEAIARGQDRILLVMATGTGKTYTAFQIIWRLWKAGRKKRILFLADRNVLIDQTMVNDFRPFGPAMAKLSTNAKPSNATTARPRCRPPLDKKRRIDTAYEVYLGLYQAITGPEERQKIFGSSRPVSSISS